MANNGAPSGADGSADPIAEFHRRIRQAMDFATHPPRVEVGMTPHRTVLREGKLQLFHYDTPSGRGSRKRPPILLVYALINKPYIMDLQPGISVVEDLLAKGLDVYLVDWGTPDVVDKDLTVNDYVNGYIENCVDKVREISGEKKINLLGYCMGGTFTTMYAALHPDKVRKMGLMAAPVAFTSRGSFLNIWAHAPGFDAWKIARTFGLVPPQFFNSAFDMLDPMRTGYEKYRSLLLHLDDREFVENFLRMERWTLEGIPMAGPTYAEVVTNGYQKDMLIQGTWKLNGDPIKLERITMPVASIVGLTDNIVPAECTVRGLEYMGSREKRHFEIPAGHIGLSTSRRAHREMWPAVADWFLQG